MVISPTDIQILFTNYNIITYFLNLASCSEHFNSIKHRILATFNINPKKINSDSLYVFKRERKFQKQWLINRSWLKYDESKNEMYCTWCKQDKVESVVTKGTSNFEHEAIKQHEISKAHLLYLHKLESINKPETSKASQLKKTGIWKFRNEL